MNLYNVTFLNKGKKICTTLQRANDEEEALMSACFKLITKYSNVHFDEQRAELVEEV